MNNFKDKLNNFFFLNEEEEIQSEGVEAPKQAPAETQKKPAPPKKEQRTNIENHKSRQVGGKNVVAINQKQALQNPQITIVEPISIQKYKK